MATNHGTQPAPVPPYGPRHRSFAGPVVLILMGVLLLLGNLHAIGWRHVGHYFARYWPALLILFGLIRLMEHFAAQRGGRRVAAVGAGGVILLIVLIIVGLTATGVDRVDWEALGKEADFDGGFMMGMFGQTHTFAQELQQELPAGANLRVVSDRGAVLVQTWDQNTIKVSVSKRLRAHDDNDAAKVDMQTRAQLNASGSELTLNASTSGAGDHMVVSDMTIYLPRTVPVSVATRRGDVTVRSRTGDVQISNTRGDITVEDITGNANLNLRRGSVHVSKVTGNVSLDGSMSNVNIADVGGNAVVTAEVWDGITFSKVAKQVAFRSSRTNLQLAKLDGGLTLQSGDLNGNEITGPVRIVTRSYDIHLEDVSGEVKVENTNGTVEIRVDKMPLGPMQVTNRKGDIRLTVPAKAAFQIEAHTRRGDINSDFGLHAESTHGESRASGVIGSGGPKLQIENEYGDVDIRKS